jgi:hypothetical protein
MASISATRRSWDPCCICVSRLLYPRHRRDWLACIDQWGIPARRFLDPPGRGSERGKIRHSRVQPRNCLVRLLQHHMAVDHRPELRIVPIGESCRVPIRVECDFPVRRLSRVVPLMLLVITYNLSCDFGKIKCYHVGVVQCHESS